MLLNQHIQLSAEARARVRLPHSSDRPGLDALHARLGLDDSPLGAARALHFDPRRETIVVATAWIGALELIVGYGAIRHDASAPHVLVCDDENAPGLRAALHGALAQATTHHRRAA